MSEVGGFEFVILLSFRFGVYVLAWRWKGGNEEGK